MYLYTRYMKEVNLKNPIFAYYVAVDGLSRQRAAELIAEIANNFEYSNITMWIVPVERSVSRIECVYDGLSSAKDKLLSDLIEELNSKIEILSSGDLKDLLRDFKINNIFKDI